MIEFAHLLQQEHLNRLRKLALEHCRKGCLNHPTVVRIYSDHEYVLFGDPEFILDIVKGAKQNLRLYWDPFIDTHPVLRQKPKPIAFVEWKGGAGFVYSNSVDTRLPLSNASFILLHFLPEETTINYLSTLEKVPHVAESSVHFRTTRNRPTTGFKVDINVSREKLKKMKRLRRELRILSTSISNRLKPTRLKEMEVHIKPEGNDRIRFAMSTVFRGVPTEYDLTEVHSILQKLKGIIASRINLSLWALEVLEREKEFKDE